MDENEELDLFEGTDEDGNPVKLEAQDYFFYNGEEYVILTPFEEYEENEACRGCEIGNCEGCEACGADDEEDEEEGIDNYYIMKIVPVTGEDGEELEELVPVEDEVLAKKLIEIANTRLDEDEDPE